MKLTTLCYIEKDDKYLMIHRIKKKHDINKDKWIGIGGKFERGESPEDCILRETKEETGLTLTSYRLRGVLTFMYNEDDDEMEYIFLYTADGFTGELADCNEGTLEWVPKTEIDSLNLWEGDRIFHRLLDEDAPFFSLKLRYQDNLLKEAVLDGKPLELLDLLDETLHAALKLAAELGARHQGGEIQQVDLLVQQLVGYVPLVDLLGQPLRNGGLAHAGLTDQTGVVLLAAVEDLDGALDLLVPADDAVQLAVSGLLSQGDAVILQKLALGLLFALLVLVSALGAGLLPLRGLGLGALSRAKELVEEGEGGGFALVLLVFVGLLRGHQALHALGAAEGGHHLIGQALQILVTDAHLLHHIFHGLDAHFLRALEAEALAFGGPALHLLDKDHGHIFMASGTKCGLHLYSAPLEGRIVPSEK